MPSHHAPPRRATITEYHFENGTFYLDRGPGHWRSERWYYEKRYLGESISDQTKPDNVTAMSRNSASTVDDLMHARASNIDPNEGRCLITNQWAPVLPYRLVKKSLTPDQFASLEWFWGFPFKRLNLDTRGNVIFIRPDLGALLDSGEFILLPDLSIIRQIHEKFRNINQKSKLIPIYKLYENICSFNYHLIPLEKMREISIIRAIPEDTLDEPLTEWDHLARPVYHFEPYEYPYTGLSPIQSRAHPHFILYHAAQRLRMIVEQNKVSEFAPNLMRHLELLNVAEGIQLVNDILSIYRKWSEPAPADFQIEPTLGPRLLPNIDECSMSSYPANHDPTVETSSERYARLQPMIQSWVEETTEAAEAEGGWEIFVHNIVIVPYLRNILGLYEFENCRSPHQLKWDLKWWKRDGKDVEMDGKRDTTRFSSNDWALVLYSTILPDPFDIEV